MVTFAIYQKSEGAQQVLEGGGPSLDKHRSNAGVKEWSDLKKGIELLPDDPMKVGVEENRRRAS